MELTPELKRTIDAMGVGTLLSKNRFAPIGDPLWTGASGDYASKRLTQLRDENPEAYTQASKDIGWNR